MKKIYKFSNLIGIIVLLVLIVACKSRDKETIQIEQLETDYPVSLRMDTSDNQVFRINFRIPFQITSEISKKYSLYSVDYYYSNKYGKSYLTKMSAGWRANFLLYNSENNKRITDNHPEFNKSNPIYIYIYTMHSLDTTEQVQSELKPYIDKMIELRQDTMSIPSFNEFKKEHPQLVKDLLQGDSISVFIKEDLLKRDNQKGDTIINIPIRY